MKREYRKIDEKVKNKTKAYEKARKIAKNLENCHSTLNISVK